MSFQTKDFATVLYDYKRYVVNLIEGINTADDTDVAGRGAAVAQVAEDIHRRLAWIKAQAFLLDADFDSLKRYAAPYGKTPNPAVISVGTVKLTGTPLGAYPSGIEMSVDAMLFTTTAGGNFDAGGEAAGVASESIDKGSATKIIVDTELTLTDPPAGVDAAATADSAFAGGDDAESRDEFLARFLEFLREPPAGGRASDFEQWCLDVAGVGKAQSFPLRRGLGTCDVVVETSDGGHCSAPVIADAQDEVDEEGPIVAKDDDVIDYTDLTQNFTVQIDPEDTDYDFPGWAAKTVAAGSTTQNIVVNNTTGMEVGDYVLLNNECRVIEQVVDPTHFTVTEEFSVAPVNLDTVYPVPPNGPEILEEILDYYLELNAGAVFICREIGSRIQDAAGVKDHDITVPAANVTPTVDADKVEKVVVGDVAIEEMP